ncbi:hypothetical protein DDQ41_16935 [Streptomyces spongiicola]|uniref:Uncharacterized protein n=1 Tax=Streptomyces spongiicola TaxID=1690221 RepID=A0ABN5KPM9_9ACTN|nr:hypothetical protein DDQ41_16935 [Streptomyces spongiicola]
MCTIRSVRTVCVGRSIRTVRIIRSVRSVRIIRSVRSVCIIRSVRCVCVGRFGRSVRAVERRERQKRPVLPPRQIRPLAARPCGRLLHRLRFRVR